MNLFYVIVFGIISPAYFVFSNTLDECTKITTTCPSPEHWIEREKLFQCHGSQRYVCLMTSGDELREGCIYNIMIPKGITGCPYTIQCDSMTKTPALVANGDFRPCPPDLEGCPAHNHPGYHITEICKYPRCQGKRMFEKSTNNPLETDITSNTTTIDAAVCGNNLAGTFVISVIISLFVVVVFDHLKKKKSLDSCKNINSRNPDNGNAEETKHLLRNVNGILIELNDVFTSFSDVLDGIHQVYSQDMDSMNGTGRKTSCVSVENIDKSLNVMLMQFPKIHNLQQRLQQLVSEAIENNEH